MLEYSAFDGLMNYFHFEFNIYCVLVLVVLINCIDAAMRFSAAKKNDEVSVPNTFGVIVSMLVGIGLFNALLFQGVLSDISSKYSEIWFNKIFILCIIAFILFVIQFILCVKTAKLNK